MQTIRSRTVKAFLENIAPINEQFNSRPFAKYIFRGQGNSKWSLLPSIFRSETKTPSSWEVVQGVRSTYREQRILEWEALKSFVLELNHNGFHLPNESLFYKLIDILDHTEEYNLFTRMEKAWPSKEYYSLLALAQHFGLPTRLMDWTYSSYIAAYFAAKKCVELQESGEKVKSLSVYALDMNSSLLKAPSEMDSPLKTLHTSSSPIVTYHVIEAPSYFNNNLKSQKGLFICCTEYGNVKNMRFSPTSLNDYLKGEMIPYENRNNCALGDLVNRMKENEKTCLIEFQLPSSHAKQLVVELDKLFINQSTLFPGISSCVQTLYDRCK